MPRTFSAVVATLLFGIGLPAGAQAARHASPPPPPPPAPAANKPRVGYAADPAPPPAPATVYAPAPVYLYSPGGYVVSGAPYLVLSDGSVLLNFGNGYERALRPCAEVRDNRAMVNQTGRDAFGRILDPPGIAALKEGTRGQASGNAPARNASACYRADTQGRVEMIAR